MQLGEIYLVKPTFTIATKDGTPQKMKGKVVWVHPKGRFAVLEFKGKTGTARECFFPEQLTAKNRVPERRRK